MAAKEAAVAHAKELETLADGARLLVILAGLGGGTGSVVAPMISKIAAQTPDCAVFAFSVLPLSVEGSQRQTLAFRAQNYLAKHCRAAFALPNDLILARLNAPIAEAFAAANAKRGFGGGLSRKNALGKGNCERGLPDAFESISEKGGRPRVCGVRHGAPAKTLWRGRSPSFRNRPCCPTARSPNRLF